MKNINLVLHTHWDREWYFTTSDSLVLMDRTFKNIFTELDKYKNITYTLDGQTSIIEEFLEINPNYYMKVQELVSRGQLIIGPWFTQTDVQLVNSESILRNLMYGMKYSLEKFGKIELIGYLPDTFGFTHQIPEILQYSGIDNFIFWRGCNFKDQQIKPYFNFVGQSKRSVTALNLYGGYGVAKSLEETNEYFLKKLIPIIESYHELGIDNNILIPVGNDQFEILKDSESKVKTLNSYDKDINFKLTTYQDAVNSVRSNTLDSYSGEFRKTAYTRVHKSIGSVRMDIKQSNYIGETKLLKRVEPLTAIASKYKIGVSQGLLDKAWKKLLEGQAHDSICACVSDSVRNDIISRNKSVSEICDGIENSILKRMSRVFKIKDNELLVFNNSLKQGRRTFDLVIFSDFKNIKIENHEYVITKTVETEPLTNRLIETKFDNIYENVNATYKHFVTITSEIKPFTFFNVIFSENKSTNILTHTTSINFNDYELIYEDNTIKLKNQQITISDFIIIEIVANDGDTYDFSPLNDFKIIENPKFNSGITSKFYSELLFTGKITVPEDLNGWKKLHDRTIKLDYVLKIIKDNNNVLKVEFDINNTANDLRVRIGIKNLNKSTHSYASTSFGSISRDINNGILPQDFQKDNVEAPIDIEVFEDFVTLKSADEEIVLLSTYGKEYQVIDSYTYLTVFSSTSTLGKADLLYRPGRASGDITKKGHIEIKTPLAQVQYKHNFKFGIAIATNDDKVLFSLSDYYRNESIFYQNQEINKFYQRIDNKIMDYEQYLDCSINEQDALIINSNDRVYSSFIQDDSLIIRLLKLDDNELSVNRSFTYVDLLGNKTEIPTNKYQIYAIKLGDNNEIN